MQPPKSGRRNRAIAIIAIALFVLGAAFLTLRGDDGGQSEHSPDSAKNGVAPPPAIPPLRVQQRRVKSTRITTGDQVLRGRVVTWSGEPAAKASVKLSGPASRLTTTNDQGRFEIDQLPPGHTFYVEAWTDDAAAAPRRVQLGPDTEPVTLRLHPAAQLVVSVIAAEDASPIEGASVDILPPPHMGDEPLRSGTTEADGAARFRGLTPGSYFVVAAAPGRTGEYMPMNPQAGLTWTHTVRLARGAAVRGRVVTRDGAPVEGAMLSRFPAELKSALTPRMPRVARNMTISDERGEFTVPAVEPGRFFLRVMHEQMLPNDSDVLDSDGRTSINGVTIVLERGGAISGTVVDADGVPQPFALVRASPADVTATGALAREVSTDENGRFAISGLPLALIELVAETSEATTNNESFDFAETPTVENATLTLAFDSVIRGVVTETDGSPIADAEVVCVGRMIGAIGLRPVLPRTTDAEGRFACTGLAPGGHHVTVRRPYPNNNQSPWMRSKSVPAETDADELTIVLPADGSIRARVVDANGAAVTEFDVSIDLNGSPRRFTSAEGTFVLDGLAPRAYSLKVSAGSKSAVVDATVAEGETTDLGKLVLE